MTSEDKRIVENLALKMGVYSERAIKKAEELIRLLLLRMSGSSGIRQLSDSSRVVLCLNLACNNLNIPFDKSDLPRLAGISKKQYSNTLHLVEKLLNLSTPVNIDSLCVQLGVSEVSAHANKLLNKYVELHSESENKKRPLDLSFPMYHCAAVFLSCKHNKVKVNKSALLDAARIKRLQFDKLLEDFSAAVEKVKSSEVQKVASKRSRSHKLIELVEKYIEDPASDCGLSNPDGKCAFKEKEEDLEAWKRRILSEVSDES